LNDSPFFIVTATLLPAAIAVLQPESYFVIQHNTTMQKEKGTYMRSFFISLLVLGGALSTERLARLMKHIMHSPNQSDVASCRCIQTIKVHRGSTEQIVCVQYIHINDGRIKTYDSLLFWWDAIIQSWRDGNNLMV
jgi:hypothetical protein